MAQYDFMVAGRWHNKQAVAAVTAAVRASGCSAYCFIENLHSNDEASVTSTHTETLSQDDPAIRQIFEADMTAERGAKAFVLVMPAGIAGHIEAGVAYGLGRPCYAIGALEKTETLYCIFEKIFPDLAAFETWLKEQDDA